jgi:hypothetical protein
MPRTTDAHVKEILPTAINTMPFIMTASALVTAHLSTVGYSEPHLAEIERWWAAHLVTVREQRTKSVKLGDTQYTYVEGGQADYWQTVLQLDTSGTLLGLQQAAAAGLQPASMYVD